MKSALIAAIVSAVVASGVASGATYAAMRISGKSIKPHSIPANRLVPSAIKSFTAGTATPRALAAAVNSTIDYEQTTSPVNAEDSVEADCPTGDVAISGGYGWVRGDGIIASSWRLDDGSGWKVQIGAETGAPNDGNGPAQITVYVTCDPSS
jgi:hypothetical protein